jgi:exodeoxyribonuclease VII large subunit
VATTRTPVVSAIGHESDTPLLDLVADLAASTPTDAGRRIVPDLAAELARISELRDRGRDAVRRRLDVEVSAIDAAPNRLRGALRLRLADASAEVSAQRDRIRRNVTGRLDAAAVDLDHVRARVRALSPQSTLDRGYAVVQTVGGDVVRDPADAQGRLRIRVARGEFEAVPDTA